MKLIQILRLLNTILFTPGPRDSPRRVVSGSGTGPLDFESPGPVPDPETLPCLFISMLGLHAAEMLDLVQREGGVS